MAHLPYMKYLFTSIRRTIVTMICLAAALVGLAIIYLEANLPSVEMLKDVQLQVPLKIYSSDGKLIAEYGEKRRSPITLAEVPKQFILAIIATEDRRFYQHPGVDLRGIIRAAVSLITKGSKEQGGSTITMQVARNFFLTRKKTYSRKINEILLALKIEQELSKDEILELYLNKIYFGKRAYGIAAATEVYYGTTIDNLTLAQMATLAGLPQAPSAINPINSPEASLKRRAHVLNRMLNYKFISQAEYKQAMLEPETSSYHARSIELEAPYVAEMARQEIIEKFGEDAYDHGLEVITTINSKQQNAANSAFRRAIFEYDQRHGFRKPEKTLSHTEHESKQITFARWAEALKNIPKISNLLPAAVINVLEDRFTALLANNTTVEINWENMRWAQPALTNGKLGAMPKTAHDIVTIGNVVYVTKDNANSWRLAQVPEVAGALVALNPNNGAIQALIGGLDYEQSLFNRATQAERQPGSAFKPFIYSIALEHGFTTASIINDAPIVQEDPINNADWRPQNYTKTFYGPTRLREGLIKSRNLVSIRILTAIGIDTALDNLVKFGFSSANLPHGLSLALGTNNITPLKLAAGYCMFPNGGYRVEPYLIAKISDYQDKIIYEHNHMLTCTTADCANTQPAINPHTAYLMTSILQDAIKLGTGRRALQLGRKDLAGKTGTTNDQYDAWYSGYNRDLVVTTWMGFDEPRSLHEYAGSSALPMWIYFMEQALKSAPNNPPQQPPGLVSVRIHPKTGLLATTGQTNAMYELFVEGTAPTKTDSNDGDYSNDANNSEDSLF